MFAAVIAESYLYSYLPAALFAVLVVVTGVGMLTVSYVLGPRRRDAVKESTYECGVPLLGSSRQQFSIKFYLVAILFVLFDIETVFLIPWAVVYKDLFASVGVYVLVEMLVFMGLLGLGFFYAWRRGGLDWD